ncbi:MAG: hypothetical protein ACOYOQ_13980 [Microthrixaceae bacterium]
MRYEPDLAFDGNQLTAWAANSSTTAWKANRGDPGRGQSITMDMRSLTRFTEVGLLPGFAGVTPDKDLGCANVDRFAYNRWIRRVRWIFPGDITYEQVFEAVPDVQSIPVDVTAQQVRVEILETVLPPGDNVDNDLLISEIRLVGAPAS